MYNETKDDFVWKLVLMSQSHVSSNLESDSGCCSRSDASSATAELKLYRAFLFFLPIFFTLVLLFLFYVFYFRSRRRLDLSSLRITSLSLLHNNVISTSDLGLKKELREMLPIVVYNESFSVKDTQCSVCLLDYQPDDRLQQIPACGHTFHMNCIDLWLASHSTCPLCRVSLLMTAKSSTETSDMQAISNEEIETQQSNEETDVIQNIDGEVVINAHRVEVEEQNARINQ